MGRFLSVIIITFLFSVNVHSQSCSTIDESQSPYLGPIDDQADYNTCYAFVASYLAGHYLKQEVNTEYLAVRYEYYVDKNQSSTVEEMMIEGMGQVGDAINAQKGFLAECGGNNHAKLQTNLSPLAYLKNLEKNCPMIKRTLKSVRNSVEDVGRDQAMNQLDQLLDQKQIAAVFGSPRFFKGFEAEDGNWLHVMTLVGRRFNSKTQSCEYVLRNTRGPDVHKSIKIHGPYNYRYEDGHFIVNRAYLKDYMSGIYYIEP